MTALTCIIAVCSIQTAAPMLQELERAPFIHQAQAPPALTQFSESDIVSMSGEAAGDTSSVRQKTDEKMSRATATIQWIETGGGPMHLGE